ncbi:MAG: hypothetical protein IPM53_05665 [Anaerolineaceae bacterium]|nr:hypothetical protein [Anaerolineaceae bacterium]
MSISGNFLCYDCKQLLWLGKAIFAGDQVAYYHLGNATEAPNWKQSQLNQALWKFLADHTSHHIGVLCDFELDDTLQDYTEIGGDALTDISLDDYLTGWPGLAAEGY